eukprot:CAMPEP_0114669538 /NCGR_PEP_ID=MMETSP0191-20121206/38225_1 /TAXON_ID=126664 /ORGANISM="Sorites sp." /LENGTH=60 /DNA_ID=CAMNT_0001925415 /DNA_START=821 /DNA_END=1000 /DNA_ORIENTATION=+
MAAEIQAGQKPIIKMRTQPKCPWKKQESEAKGHQRPSIAVENDHPKISRLSRTTTGKIRA